MCASPKIERARPRAQQGAPRSVESRPVAVTEGSVTALNYQRQKKKASRDAILFVVSGGGWDSGAALHCHLPQSPAPVSPVTFTRLTLTRQPSPSPVPVTRLTHIRSFVSRDLHPSHPSPPTFPRVWPHKPHISWHFFSARRYLRHLPFFWNLFSHFHVPFESVQPFGGGEPLHSVMSLGHEDVHEP